MSLESAIDRMKADLAAKRLKPEYRPTLTDGNCLDCKGFTWIIYLDENDNEVARPCHCQEKSRLSRRLSFAELPEAYKDRMLSTFQLNAYKTIEGRNLAAIACKTVKYYLDNFEEMQSRGMGLYIHSQTKGSGKTRMAAGIANELLKSHQVKFAVSTRIIQEIKRTWDKGEQGGSESRLIDALGMTEILIIDDFGTETVKDWIRDKFFQIVNDRYINKKVTIFTSNLGIDELGYGDRIANRIKETTYQIQFPEESVRNYIAEDNKQEMIQNLKQMAGGKSNENQISK